MLGSEWGREHGSGGRELRATQAGAGSRAREDLTSTNSGGGRASCKLIQCPQLLAKVGGGAQQEEQTLCPRCLPTSVPPVHQEGSGFFPPCYKLLAATLKLLPPEMVEPSNLDRSL